LGKDGVATNDGGIGAEVAGEANEETERCFGVPSQEKRLEEKSVRANQRKPQQARMQSRWVQQLGRMRGRTAAWNQNVCYTSSEHRRRAASPRNQVRRTNDSPTTREDAATFHTSLPLLSPRDGGHKLLTCDADDDCPAFCFVDMDRPCAVWRPPLQPATTGPWPRSMIAIVRNNCSWDFRVKKSATSRFSASAMGTAPNPTKMASQEGEFTSAIPAMTS
jgi:hypothetical protein